MQCYKGVKLMSKIKVLIVDDNEEIANFIKIVLESYELIDIVAVCFSDEDERRLIDKLKPDIVITDLVRNGIQSGLEIIKMYKSKCEIPKFLVITSEDFKVEYIELIDGFIRKPIINYKLILKELGKIIDEIR